MLTFWGTEAYENKRKLINLKLIVSASYAIAVNAGGINTNE